MALAPQALSERVPHLRLGTVQGNILVILAYASTLRADATVKDSFCDYLEVLIRSAGDKDRILLLVDMNARVGEDHESWKGCLGNFCVG